MFLGDRLLNEAFGGGQIDAQQTCVQNCEHASREQTSFIVLPLAGGLG